MTCSVAIMAQGYVGAWGLLRNSCGVRAGAMQLFVRDVAGRTVQATAEPDNDVLTLKQQLDAQGVSSAGQRLIFGGRCLGDCGIADESTVFLTMDLEGGGKKRKKKTYTKP